MVKEKPRVTVRVRFAEKDALIVSEIEFKCKEFAQPNDNQVKADGMVIKISGSIKEVIQS